MRSIADAMREQTRTTVARLAPMARVRLALELGDADTSALASSKAISLSDARRLLAQARSIGRTPSIANARRGR